MPDSSAAAPLTDPYVLVFDAKGGEGSSMLDLGGALHLGGACHSLLLVLYV